MSEVIEIEAGDYVRINPDTYIDARTTLRLRDNSAVGRAVIRDDLRGTILVRFADRETMDSDELGSFLVSLPSRCFEPVNTDELTSDLDMVDREDWKRYSRGIFDRKNPPVLVALAPVTDDQPTIASLTALVADRDAEIARLQDAVTGANIEVMNVTDELNIVKKQRDDSEKQYEEAIEYGAGLLKEQDAANATIARLKDALTPFEALAKEALKTLPEHSRPDTTWYQLNDARITNAHLSAVVDALKDDKP